MTEILRDLFYGRYIPYEHIAPKNNPTYIAINDKISEEKSRFKNMLSEDNCIRLEKLEVLYTESSGIEVEKAYMEGFRLGVMILAEIYTGNKHLPDINKILGL